MATLRYQLIGKTDKKNIYITLSSGRGGIFKKNTGYTVNIKDWSKDKNRPKQTLSELKNLKTSLDNLQTSIYKNLNESLEKKEVINANWLQKQIDVLHGNFAKGESNINLLANYIRHYIDKAPYHIKKNGQKGLAPNTLKKYVNLEKNILEYEAHIKQTLRIIDIEHTFQKKFVEFLEKHKKYSVNNAGCLIKTLKTVISDAQKNGIETNPKFNLIKGYKVKIEKIYLTTYELEQIKNTNINADYLQNAQDWLLIGCYLGQRVSDLLQLTSDNIRVQSGTELIEIEQQKTKKLVVIPLFPEVKEILNKRNGEFPRKISDVKFNKYIKQVAQLSGIDTPTAGAKMNANTKRKEAGTYPKWQLVTSHICRRSFATNYYGEIPTPLLISVTGHSTETQFLEYIGKTS